MTYDEYMQSWDVGVVKDQIVQWIREWFATNGKGCSAVVGLSGGKDSAVVAALCAEALGADRVLGVFMPNTTDGVVSVHASLQRIHEDKRDARKLVECLGIEWCTVDITAAYTSIISRLQRTGITPTDQTRINLAPRLRMSTLYAMSQSIGGRVANTCNLSEDWVGYSTRYGDSVGDFSPLSNFTSDEVIAIGKACGLPDELLNKTPSDGLCGKSDEDNLGFTYRTLNEYIRLGVCRDEEVKKRIDELHAKNQFKLQLMDSF